MGLRRKARELSLQTLYLIDISQSTKEKALSGISNGSTLDTKTKAFMNSLIDGVDANRESLDKLILKYTENWEIKRMAALDRNILRIGAFELIYDLDTPISVIIDEAVEIAKTYSTQDSGKFVNGILDKLKAERKTKQ